MSMGHLTLSRNCGEAIIINVADLAVPQFIQLGEAQFILRVQEIKADRVVLNFSASTLIKIWRAEVWQKIVAEA